MRSSHLASFTTTKRCYAALLERNALLTALCRLIELIVVVAASKYFEIMRLTEAHPSVPVCAIEAIECLRISSIDVPAATINGSSVWLSCNYELADEDQVSESSDRVRR